MEPTPTTFARDARLALLLAGVGVFAVTVLAIAPSHLAEIAWHAIVDGGVLLAWLVAAFGIGTTLLRRGDDDEPTLTTVTAIAIGLGVASLLTLGLGWAGLLNRATAIALVVIGVVLAGVHISRRQQAIAQWLHGSVAPGSWLLLLAVPPIAIAAVAALVLPGVLWGGDDPAGYDVVAYHLQMPREWFELGRITTLPHNVFSFFPLNVEMHYLLAMELRGSAYEGMYLAQLMHTAFIALTVAATAGIARRHGPLAASVAAVVTSCVPWMPMLGSVAYNEGGLMLYATLSLGWALRGRWALAGACAGFAAGCKPTGMVAAVVLVPMAAVLSLPRSRGRAGEGGERTSTSVIDDENTPRSIAPPPGPLPQAGGGVRLVRGLVLFVLLAALAVSPWLIRTALASHGNPVWPLAMQTLGHGHFDPGQIDRFVAAHSPRPDQRSLVGRLHALGTQVGGDWHYGMVAGVAPLWLLLIVPAAVLSLPRLRGRAGEGGKPTSDDFLDDQGSRSPIAPPPSPLPQAGGGARLAMACLLLLVGNVLVWLFATHLQGRFLAHVIPLAGLLVAVAATRSRVFAGVAIALAVVSFAATFPFGMLNGSLAALGVASPAELQKEILPPDVASAVYESDRPLILVGDAKAFWYAVPSSRLSYRSVFDVPSERSFADAWLGTSPPGNALVIVDPAELERFGRTYKNLPPMPEAWRGRSPFVMDLPTFRAAAR